MFIVGNQKTTFVIFIMVRSASNCCSGSVYIRRINPFCKEERDRKSSNVAVTADAVIKTVINSENARLFN